MEDDKKQDEVIDGKKVTLPLLPLRDILVFPSTVVPLFVGREKSIQALELAMSESKQIILAAQKEAKTNDPTSADVFEIGTISKHPATSSTTRWNCQSLVEGKKRAKIKALSKKINTSTLMLLS